MSSFTCEHCGTDILDTEKGYITECEHYPFDTLKHQPKGGMCNGCKKKHDGGCGATMYGDTREEVIDKWNTRHEQDNKGK